MLSLIQTAVACVAAFLFGRAVERHGRAMEAWRRTLEAAQENHVAVSRKRLEQMGTRTYE